MHARNGPRGRSGVGSATGSADAREARGFEAWLRAHSRLAASELCPEIVLHRADDLESLWAARDAAFPAESAAPPYWCVPWPGGEALARWILDHPGSVAGRSVLDVGSGSGLVALAAARAGAREVTACDIDPQAALALAMNAAANGLPVRASTVDPVGSTPSHDCVLVGDLWYERFVATRLEGWLRGLCEGGTRIFLGDPGRAHFPRTGVRRLASYPIRAMPAAGPWEAASAWEMLAPRRPRFLHT